MKTSKLTKVIEIESNKFSQNEDGEQWITITNMDLIRDYFTADPDTLEDLNSEETMDITLDHKKESATYEFHSSQRAFEDNYAGVCEWLIENGLHGENEL